MTVKDVLHDLEFMLRLLTPGAMTEGNNPYTNT